MFERVGHFLNNMDARAMTSLIVTVVLLFVVVALFVYGKLWLDLDADGIGAIMSSVAESRFALFGVIVVYCVLALTGFPQTLLFAGTVAVFGAASGTVNAWIATMVSATLTFSLGVFFGRRFVDRLSAGRAQTMIGVVRRRGLLASMIVRWTPSAPFIVINAICGAANVVIWKFWIGTGIGILPKILFVGLFTAQIDELLRFFETWDIRDLWSIIALLAAWGAFLLFVRWFYRRLKNNPAEGDMPSDAEGLSARAASED